MDVAPRHDRLGHASTMMALGGCCIVAGGLVAAVTGPLSLVHGSWLAAYLVLVCGVAQFVMGWMQSGGRHGAPGTSDQRGWAQLVCFNVGSAAVIIGTTARVPWIVDAGALLLVVALAIALLATRPGAAPARVSGTLQWVYRVLLLLLLISVPIGSLLAHLRAP